MRWARFLRMSPDCVLTTYDLGALAVVITLLGSVLFWMWTQTGSSTTVDLASDDVGHSGFLLQFLFCPS